MAKKIAVVTGASSGIGREFVRLILAEEAVDEVWILARHREKLLALQRELGDRIIPCPIDLSVLEQILAFQGTLAKSRPNIVWLINCAGFAKLGAYNDIGVEESVNMVSLNCEGTMAMGLVCLSYMSRGAKIINMSSQASFQPLPYQNIYAATKAFVRSYSRALNLELKERGITVTAVCPGWMKTHLYDRAVIGAPKAPRHFTGMAEPGKVAQKALRDAKKGKDISVYSLLVKTSRLIAKLLPERLMMRLWLMQQGL